MAKLIDYFERYLLASVEKQMKFLQAAGEHTMELDLDAGLISISTGLRLPFQVLGTESDNTLTWLWAWAEEQTEMPEPLMKASRELKAWGEREGIDEFVAPEIDLNRTDGTMIATVASSLAKASCFYREHYEGGALYLLLYGQEIDKQPPPGRQFLVRELVDAITRYDFNHRGAVLSYFRMQNLPFTEERAIVNGELATGERLITEFDDQGRLTAVNGVALG